jgi:hypothetical protein
VRLNDVAPPAFAAEYPEGGPLATWAAVPHPIIERLPTYAYGWDDEDPDVVWDAPGDVYWWDAAASGGSFIDAVCDFVAIETEAGNPDELGLFESARATVTLDNRSGAYTNYDQSGRLVYYAPGRRLLLMSTLESQWWWMFDGRITAWEDNADGTVTITAHDRFTALAQEIGTYTPGVSGEKPRERIAAIVASAGAPGPSRMDPGDVTLTRQETDRSPLEEIEVVALSDAGQVYIDADGALVYRDRLWPRGRADQGYIPVFSDNVCGAQSIVWDLDLASDDEHLATVVILTNELRRTVGVSSTDPQWGQHFILTHPDPDQWTQDAEGQAVADTLLELYETRAVSVRSFNLHLTDPKQYLWRDGIDRRLGDRIRFLHDFVAAGGGQGSFDITAVVATITHEITPESWVVGIGCWPAIDATVVQRWNRTDWLWDDADARWDY